MVQLWKKIWHSGPIESMGRAAFIIAAASVFSRLLGLLRDRILAAKFGAGDVLDAYYAAFRVPDFLYGLLVAGALSAAFVPIFTELVSKEKREEARELVSHVFTLFVIVFSLASLVIIASSSWLVPLLVPGFTPEKQYWTETLTLLMLLSPLFLGVSAVLGGVLVSFRQFLIYSLAPVFYNLGIIVGAVWLSDIFGPAGLAWGVVLGAILHMVVQWPTVRRAGFAPRLRWATIWRNRAVERVVKLMIPRSLGMAVNQIGFVVMTVFASTLMSGSLAVFTLANNIQSVPIGLFGIAFSLAVFPALSSFAANRVSEEFMKLFAQAFRRILFFVLPLSVVMIVARAQIVRVILGTGQFDWEDTIATFTVLGVLSVSLFAQSLIPLLARSFYALQNTKTPLYIALVSEAIHLLLTYGLIQSYGVAGLALAFSVASIVNFGLLYMFLRRDMSDWRDDLILRPASKIVLASLGTGVIAQLVKASFGFSPSPLDTFVEIFLQLLTTSVVSLAAFWMLATWMKIEEFEQLKTFLKRKVLGHPETIVETEETAAGER